MGSVVVLPESSVVLNVVLHSIYDISCAHYSPSFESLSAALVFMTTYGISVKRHAARSTPLHALFLSHAPFYPLELYALAASYDLYDLAVPTSSHLLSLSLASLTDEMVDRIGPRYLKRLFFLHFGRAEALKRLLLPPPHPHSPTVSCDFTEQKKLTRAWALASAYLAWDARPGTVLSITSIKRVLKNGHRPLNEHDGICTCPSGRPIILRTVQNCPAGEIENAGHAMVRCEGTYMPPFIVRVLIQLRGRYDFPITPVHISLRTFGMLTTTYIEIFYFFLFTHPHSILPARNTIFIGNTLSNIANGTVVHGRH